MTSHVSFKNMAAWAVLGVTQLSMRLGIIVDFIIGTLISCNADIVLISRERLSSFNDL